MNRERGSVLIVVTGILAALFVAGVTGLLLCSSAARSSRSTADGLRSRLAADSALQVAMAAIEQACELHKTPETGLAGEVSGSPEDMARELLDSFFQLEEPQGNTAVLTDPRRSGVFTLGGADPSPIRFSGSYAFPPCDAHSNLVRETPDLSAVAFPDPALLTADFYDCGSGTVSVTLYGWGVVLLSADTRLPVASTYTRAKILLTFTIAMRKASDDETILMSVYFPDSFRLEERRWTDDLDSIKALDWPDWGTP
jgi:hypothetical protein